VSDLKESKTDQISELIVQDFSLEQEHTLVDAKHVDELKEKLEKIIAYLLDNDFERLLNAMYRLDISEEKFKRAISGTAGRSVSAEIAELVISREIQKIETRLKYRS